MDEEDDYLSDKFLAQSVAVASSKPTTYAERRKEAQRLAEIRNEQGRKKKRKEIEEESRREGLSKSLFERAKEEGESSGSGTTKAMALMLKMGYKPGQALGRETSPVAESASEDPIPAELPSASTSKPKSGHLVEPLAVPMWAGRKGLGLGPKRSHSPTGSSSSRPEKAAKLDEEQKGAYRDRARTGYEERRAEGRLISATQTCMTLDDKAGVKFNFLSLHPQDPSSFPPGLMERLSTFEDGEFDVPSSPSESHERRLRHQMRADALEPLVDLADNDDVPEERRTLRMTKLEFSDETVEKTIDYLRLNARERLAKVLAYLRETYSFCFWCGYQYGSKDEMDTDCPGEDEDAHD